MKPIISRTGGKYKLYKKIIPLFPIDYSIYVEPFVGGGSIFFNLEHSDCNIINDNDTNLISIYKDVQNDYQTFEKSVNEVYTKELFNELKKTNQSSSKEYILNRISYLGKKNTFHDARKTIRKNFKPYYEKLKDTIILNEDYTNVIKNYDSSTTFFYLDPPYENSKKTTSGGYNDINLEELANILSNLQGKFLLSLNDSIRNRGLFKNFNIVEVETKYSIRKDRTTPVIELIITNYDV